MKFMMNLELRIVISDCRSSAVLCGFKIENHNFLDGMKETFDNHREELAVVSEVMDRLSGKYITAG